MATGGGSKFKWINGIVAVLFFISALLQLNDPDPWGWIAVYGLAAAACAIRGRVRHDWVFAAVVGLAALIWTAMIVPVISDFRVSALFQSMKAETPSIELSRELLGLLIVFGWMIVLIVVSRRSPPASG